MCFLPKTTPDAPPPPPPPAVFSFLSLSPQTFLEVIIFTAETDCKLHFRSALMMFVLFLFCGKIQQQESWESGQIKQLYWDKLGDLLKPLKS